MGASDNSLTSAVTMAAAHRDANAGPTLRGRTRVLIRALWIVIAVSVLGLVIAGIPLRYEKVRTSDPTIRNPEFRNLIGAGVEPRFAAACDVGAGIVLFVALCGGGILLFVRGSDSAAATFLSLALVLYGASLTALTSVHRSPGPPLSQSMPGLLATVLLFFQTAATFTAMFWLPEGRFLSRWTAWLAALLVTVSASIYLFVSFPRAHDLINIIGLPAIVCCVWAQTSSYRRMVDESTRNRIKWAVIGILIACLGYFTSTTFTLLLSGRSGLTPRVVMVLVRMVNDTCQMALLVCFVIAIRRYQLWHVDLVINRSLVYGSLTIVLMLVFLGGGSVLQGVLGQEHSGIAFAISTAAAGLLFNPTRKYVQRVIDRRLFGFRFDLDELNRPHPLPAVRNPGRMTGRTLGPYRVHGVLGKGGMGEVYQGEVDGRLVAIKVLPQELQSDHLKWFHRECLALAAIEHPNIVKFHESGHDDGVHYLVVDFIRGRTMGEVVRERGRLPFDELRPFLQDFSSALDYAHGLGFVHRDIKPSNIMIREQSRGHRPELVLMDFGVASASEAVTAGTGTGVVGTINYMAPEQIVALRSVDRRADIYALGITIFEILSGRLPFRGNPAQVLFAHLNQPPTDLRQLVPYLPTNVAQSVMQALEKRPEDRYKTVGDFVFALTRT